MLIDVNYRKFYIQHFLLFNLKLLRKLNILPTLLHAFLLKDLYKNLKHFLNEDLKHKRLQVKNQTRQIINNTGILALRGLRKSL